MQKLRIWWSCYAQRAPASAVELLIPYESSVEEAGHQLTTLPAPPAMILASSSTLSFVFDIGGRGASLRKLGDRPSERAGSEESDVQSDGGVEVELSKEGVLLPCTMTMSKSSSSSSDDEFESIPSWLGTMYSSSEPG